jgi:hypothetical protein
MLAWYVTFVSACDMKESQLLSKQQVSPTLEGRPLDGNLDIMRSSATLALGENRKSSIVRSPRWQCLPLLLVWCMVLVLLRALGRTSTL